MTEYQIGKVVGVSGDRIDVSFLDCTSDREQIGVPETMCINIQTEHGPQPLVIGYPGSFVKISLPNGELLAMITDIKMRESPLSNAEIKKAEESQEYLINSPQRVISTIPIGTLSFSGVFERGTDILPTVNSDVFAVLNSTIDSIYENYAEGNFSLGKLSLIPTQ